jgi:hypothetical protein
MKDNLLNLLDTEIAPVDWSDPKTFRLAEALSIDLTHEYRSFSLPISQDRFIEELLKVHSDQPLWISTLKELVKNLSELLRQVNIDLSLGISYWLIATCTSREQVLVWTYTLFQLNKVVNRNGRVDTFKILSMDDFVNAFAQGFPTKEKVNQVVDHWTINGKCILEDTLYWK